MSSFGERCVERIRAQLSAGCLRWSQLNGEAVAKLINEQMEAEDIPAKLKRAQKRAAFVPPTPDEVTRYSAEIGWPMDGEAWCANYALKGWCTSGSTKMVDWKWAVKKWKSRGWKPTAEGALTIAQQGRSSSEDALKRELSSCEDSLREILYPGQSAFKVRPTGENLERYNKLMEQRQQLKERIAAYQPAHA